MTRRVAVASRDGDRAAAFIDECQRDAAHASLPEAVGSYEAVPARDDVDAVYLPLPRIRACLDGGGVEVAVSGG